MVRGFIVPFLFAALTSCSVLAQESRSLEIYFIDVEGGQATLIITPKRESLLIDTGFPDFDGRDADRIVSRAKAAGLQTIDYVLINYYHRDHVGGVPQLVDRIQVGTFVDHGPNREDSDDVRAYYAAYEQVVSRSKRIVLKPGDRLRLAEVTLQAISSAGETIRKNLPGAGQTNDLCASEPETATDVSENARSLGILLTFGRFRFLDLGDLTKRKEIALACPVNRIGPIDLYLTSHHGLDQSNARALVHALHPRVAIMNNGARKGGKPAAWQIVHDSPGLQDLWQLHYAIEAGADHNVSQDLIANPQEQCEGHYLKVSAQSDGTFSISNSRNRYSKTYFALLH